MAHTPQKTSAALALVVGLFPIISANHANGATWAESFEGRFARNYFVEPQEMNGGWSNMRINPAAGYSGRAGAVNIVKTPVRVGNGAMKCERTQQGRRMELELVNRDENEAR